MQGLLLVNKPSGITSFGAVARIKRLAHEKRVGHTGTLDPMATGVLPVFIGRATVLSSHLLEAQKTYIASAKLGITTDTLDITGKTVSESGKTASNDELLRVLSSFNGKQMQTPPMFSALKQNGVRLYDMARRGETVSVPPREIEIFSLKPLKEIDKNGEFSFETTVSKGTYIRSLVRDIGKALETGAVLTSLTRTETAGFNIKDCISLDALTEENIAEYILPADKAVEYLDKVSVTKKQMIRFKNGGQLDLDRVNVSEITDKKIYRVYSENEFLGLGYIDKEAHQLAIKCLV